jgi:hypothetical protein
MAWLAKLLADARETDIDVLIVQALVILSGLGLLLSLVAGLTFGLDFPPNLFWPDLISLAEKLSRIVALRHLARRKYSGASAKMSEMGVRRAKAALSSGCKPRPAIAPAGSNRSSHGGNEVAEAFD